MRWLTPLEKAGPALSGTLTRREKAADLPGSNGSSAFLLRQVLNGSSTEPWKAFVRLQEI